jgi:serine/threonine protein phosphatase PrpC
MSDIQFASRAVGSAAACQDRAGVFMSRNALVLVVADGAGGVARGEHAAEALVRQVEAHAASVAEAIDPIAWVTVLKECDAALSRDRRGGETTAVICAIDSEGRCGGASVGDSRAWFVNASPVLDLTINQKRKPLIGSGRASPAPFFQSRTPPGTLLLGTDGLFNYVAPARIVKCLEQSNLGEAIDLLLDAARVATGALQDDVGIAISRHATPSSRLQAQASQL